MQQRNSQLIFSFFDGRAQKALQEVRLRIAQAKAVTFITSIYRMYKAKKRFRQQKAAIRIAAGFFCVQLYFLEKKY